MGWSYGGILSWHWADRNPDRVLGIVTVDAFPGSLTGVAGPERIRKEFRRARLLLPIARRCGMGARMGADQHAEVNVELNEIGAASVPVLERIACPLRFVLATGTTLGNQGDEMEQGRAALGPILAGNPNLEISAKVASSHSTILRKDFPAVAQAVRELAPPDNRTTDWERWQEGLTIGQAAAFAGVRVKTVRHHHRLDLLDEPCRDTSWLPPLLLHAPAPAGAGPYGGRGGRTTRRGR